MQVVEDIFQMKALIKEFKAKNQSIGFVPTMGYLHEGHLSLVKEARKQDKVVLSFFVNPMQFGVNEDLEKYPRNLEQDTKLCEENGVDVLFAPSILQMYPKNFSSFVDVKGVSEGLCGASRKGHFRGVCTILTKFFNLIEPNVAYFGQKDAQQCAVVKQMVKDLNMNLDIQICPIVREENQLAKSSRNVYLSKEEQAAALVLSKAVFLGQELVLKGERNAKVVEKAMCELISKEKLAKIDYVSLVDPNSLQELERINSGVLGAVAVYIGKTRLIDNFLLKDLKCF